MLTFIIIVYPPPYTYILKAFYIIHLIKLSKLISALCFKNFIPLIIIRALIGLLKLLIPVSAYSLITLSYS